MAARLPRSLVAACAAAALCAAALAPAPDARAQDVQMAPTALDEVTPDGLNIHIGINNEVVNAVPNLAEAQNSREAFVTLVASTSVSDPGPILDSLFITGYQLGCQSDVSAGLQFGGAVSGGVAASDTLGALPGGAVGGGATGYAQTVLEPGVIVDLPMSNMTLSPSGHATLAITNLHVKADAYGGDVTIRSYAYLRVSTANAHSSYATYGDPIKI